MWNENSYFFVIFPVLYSWSSLASSWFLILCNNYPLQHLYLKWWNWKFVTAFYSWVCHDISQKWCNSAPNESYWFMQVFHHKFNRRAKWIDLIHVLTPNWWVVCLTWIKMIHLARLWWIRWIHFVQKSPIRLLQFHCSLQSNFITYSFHCTY